jgi:hypothetical protein
MVHNLPHNLSQMPDGLRNTYQSIGHGGSVPVTVRMGRGAKRGFKTFSNRLANTFNHPNQIRNLPFETFHCYLPKE